MKKLFYIVLVIVALMVISRFVKEKSNTAATTTAVTAETSEPVTATLRLRHRTRLQPGS